MEQTFTGIEYVLRQVYGNDKILLNKELRRFQKLEKRFSNYFGDAELHYFSTPGRIEISGNHTDHNNGMVLASSIDLDTIAIASFNDDEMIKIYSEGYDDPFIVQLKDLNARSEEIGTSNAIVRGMVFRCSELGVKIGGLNICISSNVLPGSGLSSSASFEVLIGTIFNSLYNDSQFSPEKIAAIGQYAENEFFGKPCGLMDQMTCSVGGIIFIDFKEPNSPIIRKISFDFKKENCSVLVVDTGGNHADLTEDYASIPSEMKAIAESMNTDVLRNTSEKETIQKIPELRKKYGDRAVLRSLHFFNENNRVTYQVAALENDEFSKFLSLVQESGDSSSKLLQNIYTSKNIREQGLSLALALTEKFLSKINEGACRVHGGGFAGTILVFMPNDHVKEYLSEIEPIFGEGCVKVLTIRQNGSLYLNKFEN